MKKFVLFVIPCYYPAGGVEDIHSSHETMEAARATADTEFALLDYGWVEIVDRDTWERLYERATDD